MGVSAIRWLAFLAVVAASGGTVYYEYQNIRPCGHPIQYAIGGIDARFGVADATLANTAEAASAIWNAAAGKTVLAYDPKADLKINLIYDAREAAAKQGGQIARQQAEEDTARAALDALRAQYVAKETAYNQAVRAANARGGAMPSETNAFAAQLASLNNLAVFVDGQVADYNARVAALNAEVARYNKNAGQTFREGEYISDSAGQRIDVFEFVGDIQLERVLAHEFGHALGLGHNSDPTSVMFAKNESGNLVPTASDLAALRAVCGS